MKAYLRYDAFDFSSRYHRAGKTRELCIAFLSMEGQTQLLETRVARLCVTRKFVECGGETATGSY